jgi:phenylpyruvate tautomerase PptA (4-oxalocrotonate tautomerase family)
VPYLQLDLPFAVPSAQRTGFADRLARLYAETMETDPRRVVVAFRELGELGVLGTTDDGPQPAVVVHCDIRRGRPAEVRARLAERLCALVEEATGWPAGAVVVYVTQHPGEEIFRDGRLLDDWSPAEAGARA